MSTVWLGELKVIVSTGITQLAIRWPFNVIGGDLTYCRLSDVRELALFVETLLNWLLLC